MVAALASPRPGRRTGSQGAGRAIGICRRQHICMAAGGRGGWSSGWSSDGQRCLLLPQLLLEQRVQSCRQQAAAEASWEGLAPGWGPQTLGSTLGSTSF